MSEFVITRTLAAPRDLVFSAWTDPAHLARWWGPKGCPVQVERFELEPGGMFLYSMSLPNGAMWWGRFLFHEIAAPERLVYASGFAGPDGELTRAPFASDFPLEVLNTVTFEALDARTTRLTLRGGPIDPTEAETAFYAGMHESMRGGFGGTLDQLEAWLAERV